ncbi:hypothetical protein THAOC_08165 [Thalassiosira oceanica]|uniref:Uncharacterized protein n=1 Tax=Thalassiosira oceanica TaxID=159749 RepID=K0SVM7_THAOC|nr:hypothetical protein THAOC_08165 [Thalassiosira oceanica]|eukprot:EJK70473.1 hypothetical protein THAOC_08165 [Thalassiosira oceanica]
MRKRSIISPPHPPLNAAAHAEAQRTISSQQAQIQGLQQQIQQQNVQPQAHDFLAQQQAAAQQAAAQQAAAQQAMMQHQLNFMHHSFQPQQQPFQPPQPFQPQAPPQQPMQPRRQQPSVWTPIPMPSAPPPGVNIDPATGKGSDGRNYRVFHQQLNYCPTCGCSTDDNHLPSQCPRVNKHPNHNNRATRGNPMGGTYKGQHKFMFIPSNGHVPRAGGRGGRGNRRNQSGGRGARGRNGRGGYQQQQQYGTGQYGQMNFVAAQSVPGMNQQWNGNNQQWSYASPSM